MQVNNIYYVFSESVAQWEIVMVKIMIYQMLLMYHDVVILLKKVSENFSKNGLTTVQGENMALSTNQF